MWQELQPDDPGRIRYSVDDDFPGVAARELVKRTRRELVTRTGRGCGGQHTACSERIGAAGAGCVLRRPYWEGY